MFGIVGQPCTNGINRRSRRCVFHSKLFDVLASGTQYYVKIDPSDEVYSCVKWSCSRRIAVRWKIQLLYCCVPVALRFYFSFLGLADFAEQYLWGMLKEMGKNAQDAEHSCVIDFHLAKYSNPEHIILKNKTPKTWSITWVYNTFYPVVVHIPFRLTHF